MKRPPLDPLRVLPQSSKTKAMAAVLSVTHAQTVQREDTPAGRGDLARFREEFYGSLTPGAGALFALTARADALFELTDGAPRGAGVPDGGERPPIFPSS